MPRAHATRGDREERTPPRSQIVQIEPAHAPRATPVRPRRRHAVCSAAKHPLEEVAMKVEQLMQRSVQTCRAHDALNRAAQIMWENDCGCVPVVDDAGCAIGMITDRDVCMAAYTRGRTLGEIDVGSVMTATPRACRPQDTVREAETIMCTAQVRRLPVVDNENRLVGILSLNDIALEAQRGHAASSRSQDGVHDTEVCDTLGAIGQRHVPKDLQPIDLAG
jgi:CBS domain-containing protein